MIQPLPTLLARAKRKGHPLLLCEVSCVEQIQGCLAAAVELNVAVALTLSAGTAHQFVALESLLPLATLLAETTTVGIGVEVRLTTPLLGKVSALPSGQSLAVTLPSMASLEGLSGDLIASCVSLPAAKLAASEFLALRVPAQLARIGLVEAVRELKRPLILEEATLTPARLKSIAQSGVSGISLANQIHASFTAGVRAALRDRELSEPAGYLARGQTAVRERVKTYLQYLET